MKILIVSPYFPPKASIASLRAYSFAKRWSAVGHDVTVLAASKHDFELSLNMDCSSFKVIFSPLPRIHAYFARKSTRLTGTRASRGPGMVARAKRWAISKASGWREATGILKDQRMPSHMDPWVLGAWRRIPQGNWDVVLTTYSPYVSHLIGLWLKRNGRAKVWIADYRDLWTESHMFRGARPFTWIEGWLEGKVNANADYVTTVSEPLAGMLRKRAGSAKVEVIENGFDPTSLCDLPPARVFDDAKITLAYTGSLYPRFQDPKPLFQAMANISRSVDAGLMEGLQIVFAGIGSDTALRMAEDAGVGKWVQSMGFVDRDMALRMQRDAYALLFFGSGESGAEGILTGKLFEYLYSGTQVWALATSANCEPGKIINASGCGRLLGSGPEALQAELLALLREKTPRRVSVPESILGRYGRDALADRMLALAVGRGGRTP